MGPRTGPSRQEDGPTARRSRRFQPSTQSAGANVHRDVRSPASQTSGVSSLRALADARRTAGVRAFRRLQQRRRLKCQEKHCIYALPSTTLKVAEGNEQRECHASRCRESCGARRRRGDPPRAARWVLRGPRPCLRRPPQSWHELRAREVGRGVLRWFARVDAAWQRRHERRGPRAELDGAVDARGGEGIGC